MTDMKLLGYCPECEFEIFDIDEEFTITGEATGSYECPTCRSMQTLETIIQK